jgi:hypothetical protein
MTARRQHWLGVALEWLAHRVTEWTGGSWAFGAGLATIVVWGVTGPIFGYSDTWQLVINTGTTIITFLMVFLIQRSQNKDSRAVHLKLNELVAALQGAGHHCQAGHQAHRLPLDRGGGRAPPREDVAPAAGKGSTQHVAPCHRRRSSRPLKRMIGDAPFIGRP